MAKVIEESTAVEEKPVTIVNKVSKGKKLVLQEVDEVDETTVPHSGSVEDGVNIYDKSPVNGLVMQTQKGKLINHRGHEVDEDGTVLDPDKYKDEGNFGLG